MIAAAIVTAAVAIFFSAIVAAVIFFAFHYGVSFTSGVYREKRINQFTETFDQNVKAAIDRMELRKMAESGEAEGAEHPAGAVPPMPGHRRERWRNPFAQRQ